MSVARSARRIAAGAAYGGGGVGLLGAAVTGVLVVEAKLARRWIGEPTELPPYADGVYGAAASGDAGGRAADRVIDLVMLGDSSAAGLGVDDPQQTPGALIAAGLAAAAGCRVRLRTFARTGAQTADLERQVDLALAAPTDIVVVLVGANDVTHRVRPSASVRLLDQAVRRLRDAGAHVVVATCPDLGTVEPVAQPLRLIARRWSRRLAAAQTIAAVEAGGRTVSLGDILGPEFAAAPKVMFAADRFHPSAAGYRAAATALLPSVCAAMGVWPAAGEDVPDARLGEGVRSVVQAAAQAVERPGTEVAPTEVAGHERGPRGRWAFLRIRRRRALPAEGTGAASELQALAGSDDEAAGPGVEAEAQ